MTRFALISPPVYEPRSPYLAVPLLTASLRARGHEVRQWDFNLEVFSRFLSRDYLEDCSDAVRAKPCADPTQARRVRSALRRAPYTIRHIERACELLRSKPGGAAMVRPLVNLERAWALVVARSALDLISARYQPTRLAFGELESPYRVGNSRDLVRAVHDESSNPFREVFARELLPRVLAEKPQIVGISINDRTQVIPGLTAAALARGPGRFVVVGGVMFPKGMGVKPELFELCDGFVAGDGVPALVDLAAHADGKLPLEQVRNLLWLRDGAVVSNSSGHELISEDPPTPVFSEGRYFHFFDEELSLPIFAGKGCYWNQCAFCNIAFEERHAPPDPARVLRDAEHLLSERGTRSFFLTSESLAPVFLRRFSEAVIEKGLDIRWSGYARLEEAFDADLCSQLAASGCRRLLMGLESGCQRILDLHHKGINVETAGRVLRNLSRAGIGVHLFMILGSPTERREEAQMTMDFLRQHAELLDANRLTVTFGPLFLSPHSALATSPEQFGVNRLVVADPDNDLGSEEKFLFESPGGLSRAEASALAARWYRELEENLHHYGIHRLLWGPEINVPSVPLRAANLSYRLCRHALRSRMKGLAKRA